MNIAIDIDDTLTESFDYFLPAVAEYFGVDADELRAKNISYGNLPEAWKKEEINFSKTYYDHMAADTPFKPDALWGVSKLRELGHKIVIITGRSDAFYTDPYKTTKQELENGGIPYDKLICTLDKAKACVEENISVLIDDLPANCDAVAQKGISVLLFSSKANRDVEREYTRVENWKDAVEAVMKLQQ